MKFECKQREPFKFFDIAVYYSFLFTIKFREHLFPKRVLIYQEKTSLMSTHYLGHYGWRVDISLKIGTGKLLFKGIDIYGETGTQP